MTPLRQRLIEDLKLRNRSPRTIEAYVQHVARFAKHFGRSPAELGAEEIREYQLHLLGRQVSWSTFNQCVSALRFLYSQTLGQREPLERLHYGRKPKKLPRVLSQEQVLDLLACVSSRQHQLVLTAMYATGLRVGEAVRLAVTDIDSREMTILVARGKGNKQRLVPLSQRLLQELRGWWRTHRHSRWLFPSPTRRQPINVSGPQKALKTAVNRLGLPPEVCSHTLRHTFATELLEAGVDLLTIQKILGHADLSTTLIYTHVRRDHLRAVGQILELLPLAQIRQRARAQAQSSRRISARKSPR